MTERKLTKNLTVELTVAQLQRLREAARQAQVSMGEFVRRRLRDVIGEG